MKDQQSFKLKFKWPAILRAPFSPRKKQRDDAIGDDTPKENSCETDGTARPISPDAETLSPGVPATADVDSSTREPSTSIEVNFGQFNSGNVLLINDFFTPDGRSHSPSPSQATRTHRHSVSKATSGENVRVSLTVDTIKQQLNDGLQMLAEFKKSLRASSDVQRYNEAIGSFEGAADGLATLKSKLNNRKLVASGSGNGNRNSLILPLPDLDQDTPFSIAIPGIEEPQVLEVVEENKENEAQEENT